MNEPSGSVVWTLVVPLFTSVIVTVAPGTAAPCSSLTVPTMVPVVTWACAVVTPSRPASESAIAEAPGEFIRMADCLPPLGPSTDVPRRGARRPPVPIRRAITGIHRTNEQNCREDTQITCPSQRQTSWRTLSRLVSDRGVDRIIRAHRVESPRRSALEPRLSALWPARAHRPHHRPPHRDRRDPTRRAAADAGPRARQPGVVREAIKVLAAKGLVVSRPKTGTRVRPPESWNLLDPDVLAWRQEGLSPGAFLGKLTEVRLIIEPGAAELAARRAGPDQVRALQVALRDMRDALDRTRPRTTRPTTRRTSASTAPSCRPATTTSSSRWARS